jgi:hypothetical protein
MPLVPAGNYLTTNQENGGRLCSCGACRWQRWLQQLPGYGLAWSWNLGLLQQVGPLGLRCCCLLVHGTKARSWWWWGPPALLLLQHAPSSREGRSAVAV